MLGRSLVAQQLWPDCLRVYHLLSPVRKRHVLEQRSPVNRPSQPVFRLPVISPALTCMNSHVQHYINALALSVMVGELMGGALGMALVGPTHR